MGIGEKNIDHGDSTDTGVSTWDIRSDFLRGLVGYDLEGKIRKDRIDELENALRLIIYMHGKDNRSAAERMRSVAKLVLGIPE